jgi:DNA-3-methyladenine glycosylase II
MARALDEVGFPEPRGREDGFACLLQIIVCQQVSKEAGAAIWLKLEKRLVDVTVDKVRRVRETTLKSCGLSRPKVRYAKALALAINSGSLNLDGLDNLTDDEVREALTAVTGIGAWTAEIYLMFALGRPDILPSGDLALAVSAQGILGLAERPTPSELEIIAERWAPFRTAAAIMLWHCYRRAPLID